MQRTFENTRSPWSFLCRFIRPALVACTATAVLSTGSTVFAAGSPATATGTVPSDAASVAAQQAARDRIVEQLQNASSEDARLARIVDMVFLDEKLDPITREEARKILPEFNFRKIADQIVSASSRMESPGLLEALNAVDWLIPDMKGVDYRVNAFVGRMAQHPDAAVRAKATDIAVRYKINEAYFSLRKRCNQSSGADRLAAIKAIGGLADARSAWFLPALIDSKESGVAEATFVALAQLGRAGTLAIKERLNDPNPSTRLMAIRTLMPLALIDDLPPLYEFAQKNPGMDESLKNELFTTIAKLEVIRDQGFEAPKH